MLSRAAAAAGLGVNNDAQKISRASGRVVPFRCPVRNYIPPPFPPFLAKRHFSEKGGGGVYFEAPRCRNFIPPPFSTPPTLVLGYFQGWEGGGVYAIRPCKMVDPLKSLSPLGL